MSSDWSEVSLGEVLRISKVKLGEYVVEPRVLSLSKYAGFVPADEYFDKRIASASLENYKIVMPGEWAYSTIHIDEGSIARNTLGYMGVLSPMYTTMRWVGDAHEPEYFQLLLRSPLMLTRYSDAAQGTVNRRRSLPYRAFSDMRVLVPPLPVQRRIVDLMAHLDNHLANLKAEREAARSLLSTSLGALDGAVSGAPTVELGKVGTFRSGPSWSAKDETSHVVGRSQRVLKITNTRPDGTIDMSDETYVVGLPQSSHRLRDSSLVIIRTNGNRKRIGNVYRPTGEALGCVVSAFQFSGEFETSADRDWVYWWLRAPVRQSAMSKAASGSTGLGNLAVSWLNSLEVPWPEESDRLRLTAPLEALAHVTEALSTEIAAQEDVRRSLLGALLNGTFIVPESYDAFLSEVA